MTHLPRYALAPLVAALILPTAASAQSHQAARVARNAPHHVSARGATRSPLGRRARGVATPPLEIPREASLQAAEGQNPRREVYRAWSSLAHGQGVLHDAAVEGTRQRRVTVELNSLRGRSRIVELTVDYPGEGRPARVVSMRPASRWHHANLGEIAGRTQHEALRVDPIHRYQGEFNVVQRSVVQAGGELRVSTTGHVRLRNGVLHIESFNIVDLSAQPNTVPAETQAYLRTHFVRQLAERFPEASELQWRVPGGDTPVVLPEGVTTNRVVSVNEFGSPRSERQIHVDLAAARN